MPTPDAKFLVADRIWIAVALLHRQAADRESFSKEEIRRKMREIGVMEGVNPATVAPHLNEHMVANEPSSTGKYQMLFKTPSGDLRLFLPGMTLIRVASREDLRKRSSFRILRKFQRSMFICLIGIRIGQ